MYDIDIKPNLDKKLEKLIKKNRMQYEIVMKKIGEVIISPNRYKNLKKPLQHLKRVHIDTHFVLTFSVEDKANLVIFEDFDHHDKIYLN